jgi:hypothetical protein
MKKIIFILLFLFVTINQASSQTDTIGLTPFLDWPDLPGATQYQLQISTGPTFSNLVLNVSGLTQSQYQVPSGTLICNTHYYWRYRGFIGGVWGSWSNIFEFTTTCTGIGEPGSKIPDEFILYQNYPNPFNPATTISFALPKYELVRLAVYDINGKEIDELINESIPAGNYSVVFEAYDLSSGIYFYSINAGDFKETKKMILVK